MLILEILRSTSVPAPELVAADAAGQYCDVPALLISRLAGHPPRPADMGSDDFCRQLAQTLCEIHDVDSACRTQLAPYRLYYDRVHANPARWMSATPVWAQSIALVRAPLPKSTMTFIHRDYHPENTLWSRRRLTGVVDWTQASWGPPELDVGHMRWNLVIDQGQQVADQFLASYRAVSGNALHDQAYWDLVSLFDLLLGDGDEPGDIDAADLRRLEDHAKAALSHRG